MTRWEYRMMILPVAKDSGADELAAAGEEGWEAIGLSVRPEGDCLVMLKREKKPQWKASAPVPPSNIPGTSTR